MADLRAAWFKRAVTCLLFRRSVLGLSGYEDEVGKAADCHLPDLDLAVLQQLLECDHHLRLLMLVERSGGVDKLHGVNARRRWLLVRRCLERKVDDLLRPEGREPDESFDGLQCKQARWIGKTGVPPQARFREATRSHFSTYWTTARALFEWWFCTLPRRVLDAVRKPPSRFGRSSRGADSGAASTMVTICRGAGRSRWNGASSKFSVVWRLDCVALGTALIALGRS